MLASGKYEKAFLNRALSTITGGEVKSGLRPDVAAVAADGKIDIVEILSPGQSEQDFINKFSKALGDRLGTITFRKPTTLK
jgi:hypothetical protein